MPEESDTQVNARTDGDQATNRRDRLRHEIAALNREMAAQGIAGDRLDFASRAGLQFGGERDMWDVLGYKSKLQFDDYLARYRRQDVAGLIVDLPAETTWKDDPEIQDPGAAENDSDFVNEFEELAKRLRLWPMYERADKLAGIGWYSIVVLGVADAESTEEWEEPLPDTFEAEDLLFVRPFRFDHVDIAERVDDTTDPRHGKPKFYWVEVQPVSTTSASQLTREPKMEDVEPVKVHHSRVIHIAENTGENDIFGRPRLQRAYNRLDDLLKVVGGGAEMWWQDAAAVWHVDYPPEVQIEDDDLEAVEDDLLEIVHGLRRRLQTRGASVDVKRGQIPNPQGYFEMLKAMTAVAAGIPERVLFGSERGELASTQDQREWGARIMNRRTGFVTERMIRPFIDRLLKHRVISPPTEPYEIEWANVFELDEQEEADVAAKVARAMRDVVEAKLGGFPVTEEEMRETVGLVREMPDLADRLREIEREDEAMRDEIGDSIEGEPDGAQ